MSDSRLINPQFLMYEQALAWTLRSLGAHLRIRDYLEVKYRKSRGATTQVFDGLKNGEAEYWNHLLHSKSVRQGQIIELRNFQLTNWVPLLPGTWWTRDSQAKRAAITSSAKETKYFEEYKRHANVYSPTDKVTMMSSGYGSFRLKSSTRTQEGFALFCATSGDSWKGIPLLLSPEIISKIDILQANPSTKGLEIEKVEGILCPLPFSLRGRLPTSITAGNRGRKILNALDCPELVLVVASPLSIKVLISDHRIRAALWASFNWELKENRVPGFVYCLFDPQSPSAYAEAKTFLRGYAGCFRAIEIISDCDEYNPWETILASEETIDQAINRYQNDIKEYEERYAKWETSTPSYEEWYQKKFGEEALMKAMKERELEQTSKQKNVFYKNYAVYKMGHSIYWRETEMPMRPLHFTILSDEYYQLRRFAERSPLKVAFPLKDVATWFNDQSDMDELSHLIVDWEACKLDPNCFPWVNEEQFTLRDKSLIYLATHE